MAKKSPAFQFYPTDFLGDKNVVGMDAEQVGMYWLLICIAWQGTPRGTLPNDEKLLAKYARVSLKVWRKKNEAILNCFEEKKGKLCQKRLQQEAKKQDEWRKKSSIGGKKSAESRRKKGVKGGSRVVQPPHIPNGNIPSPSPSPSPSSSKKISTLSARERADAAQRIFEAWIAQKVIVHKTLTADMVAVVNKTLTTYPLSEVLEAIENYGQVVNSSDHFFNYRWTLEEFLIGGGKDKIRHGNLKRFLSESKPLDNFKEAKNGKGNDDLSHLGLNF